MSKRSFSKTYTPGEEVAAAQASGPDHIELARPSGELVSQLQTQLEIAQHDLNYVAQEMHDNLGHLAYLIHIHLNLLTQTRPEHQKEKIEEIRVLVSELNQEIKWLSIDLSTPVPTPETLEKLLLKEILRFEKLDLFKLNYIVPDHWPELSGWKSLELLRMVQEILNNILKHSEANKVRIEVSQQGTFLNLNLEDNGIGFDLGDQTGPNHLGLKNLYDRARTIDARLQVNSKQQQGTSFHISLPIQ